MTAKYLGRSLGLAFGTKAAAARKGRHKVANVNEHFLMQGRVMRDAPRALRIMVEGWVLVAGGALILMIFGVV